jgi:hypothetical protein
MIAEDVVIAVTLNHIPLFGKLKTLRQLLILPAELHSFIVIPQAGPEIPNSKLLTLHEQTHAVAPDKLAPVHIDFLTPEAGIPTVVSYLVILLQLCDSMSWIFHQNLQIMGGFFQIPHILTGKTQYHP